MEKLSVYLLEIKKIDQNSSVFHKLEKKGICYSYFKKKQKYYLFGYSRILDFDIIDAISQEIEIIAQLNKKQRVIRSVRGYILYTLEIMGNKDDLNILRTNLPKFFWQNVENVIRQNKKNNLLKFLVKNISDEVDESEFEKRLKLLEHEISRIKESLKTQ